MNRVYLDGLERGTLNELLTLEAACTMLGVSERSIRRAISSGELIALEGHGEVLVRRSDVRLWRASSNG